MPRPEAGLQAYNSQDDAAPAAPVTSPRPVGSTALSCLKFDLAAIAQSDAEVIRMMWQQDPVIGQP